MRTLVAILCVWSGTLSAPAAPVLPPFRQSQQFTVIDARGSLPASNRLTALGGRNLIKLDIDVLLLTAERVREALLSELELPGEGAGKIRLALYPASRPDEWIGVEGRYSPGQWEYRVNIPDHIDATTLVRGIVHALLLEIANRYQGPRSAELPLWLVEGLTYRLFSVAGMDMVVNSVPLGSMKRIIRERRGLDYLERARVLLRSGPLPTFSELAYPPVAHLRGDRLKTFQSAAELFVHQLLEMKNGEANLVAVLRHLPNCWNWETALLQGFSSEFRTMLDVEKRWSVDVLAFTAHDPSQVWTLVVCLDRLEDVLGTWAQVRLTANSVPMKKRVPLQEVISTWDYGRQAPVLRQKLPLLQSLRFHSPKHLAPIVDEYYRTIAEYLAKRDAAARTPETRMQLSISPILLAQDTVAELNDLDQRSAALRPENTLSAKSR